MNNEYNNYIKEMIPNIFSNLLVIDTMADLVMQYIYSDGQFICNNTTAFTSFYANLENEIYPDDLKSYTDSLSTVTSQVDLSNGPLQTRYEFRKKNADGTYEWYTNIIRTCNLDGKNISIILEERINDPNHDAKNAPERASGLMDREKVIFEAVSNAIIKLNRIVNINCSSNNLEVRGITNYMSNVLLDLTNSFPEISSRLSESMINTTNQGEKTLLIVDDDKVTCNLLSKAFDDTYKILTANDGQEAIDILKTTFNTKELSKKDNIVGIFLDLNMPVVDGFGVLDYMSDNNLLSKLPIIIISGDYDQETKNRAYLYPIADVLEKPFNIQVVKHRIKNFVKLYKANNSLNDIVLTQHQEIKNILLTFVKSYIYDNASDIRIINKYVNIIGNELRSHHPEYRLDDDRLQKLVEASTYYNIGLYALPQKLLTKSEVNQDEKKIIESNPFVGCTIFENAIYRSTDSVFNRYVKEIISYHNENYDGSGYPSRMSGENIPIAAQIVRVAADYNQLLKTMDSAMALEELVKQANAVYNPIVVECLKNGLNNQ